MRRDARIARRRNSTVYISILIIPSTAILIITTVIFMHCHRSLKLHPPLTIITTRGLVIIRRDSSRRFDTIILVATTAVHAKSEAKNPRKYPVFLPHFFLILLSDSLSTATCSLSTATSLTTSGGAASDDRLLPPHERDHQRRSPARFPSQFPVPDPLSLRKPDLEEHDVIAVLLLSFLSPPPRSCIGSDMDDDDSTSVPASMLLMTEL
ncbi:hypothetical protein L484_012183 [Morus notabilis]|uniref:Uncharacterized protein n=1 Tax=Morus notabilis TaxID=981085 RepID=W9RJ23_9ROSA|nr:hypothetical protein L484_012183 [Morus notabilis]